MSGYGCRLLGTCRFRPRRNLTNIQATRIVLPGSHLKVPRRNSSPVGSSSVSAGGDISVLIKVNAAFGQAGHIARSFAVVVSHPNLNLYRPGLVHSASNAQVILLSCYYDLGRTRKGLVGSSSFISSSPTAPPASRKTLKMTAWMTSLWL